ncbi:MAG: nuclear transport factor 2 family protein [Pseudomonadota bacterium]
MCTQLVLDYAYYRDRADGPAVGSLFTDDARMTVRGETVVGREQIEARTRSAASGPTTMHLISTIHIRPEGASRARGTSYVTVYVAGDDEASAGVPAPVEGFAIVGAYEDLFVRTPGGWRIAERLLRGVLRYRDES